MTTDNPPQKLATNKRPDEDLTGRARLFSNLLHSWGGYFIVFVAGFIIPRLIDRSVGQAGLGIWDFSWSFVNYMRLTMMGLGSSVNRYVARYRAVGDVDKLNQVVSTVMCLQIGVAIAVLIMSAIFAWLIPDFFQARLGDQAQTARWVVFLLGSSISVAMLFDTSRGVITGCHRWDLHNLINSGSQACELLGMLVVFWFGGGLIALSAVLLGVEILSNLIRLVVSRRLCPELLVKFAFFRKKTAKEMYRFGMKSFVNSIPQLILVQTTNMLIVGSLGPASLAVFARSMALVRHVETFINKFAYILAPAVGSLQGLQNDKELRRFFLTTTRYGVAFAIPLLLALIFYGDLILRIWMGARYSGSRVLAILALGYFLPTSQNSVREILTGLNRHGKVGLFGCVVSMVLFALGALLVDSLGWTLERAALLLSVSVAIGIGIAPGIYACKSLGIPYYQYLRNSFLSPVCCNLAFIACLLGMRKTLGDDNPITVLVVGGGISGFFLALLYLRFIFPKDSWARIFPGKLA